MSLLIEGVSVAYGARQILHGVSLPALPAGSLVALVGPNGAGKSTLLRALAGLERMRGGLSLDGQDVTRLGFAERSRRLAYMPQQLPPGIALGVLESIVAALRVSGSDDLLGSAYEALRQLGIEGLAERSLDSLSGGQRQLVALAQLMARNPQVLLLDEPTSALDLHYQLRVMGAVRERVQAHRLLAVAVLHDINLAASHADWLVVLREGRVVACGAPGDVLQPGLLAEVYGVEARVECCSQGRLQVLVDRALA
ncbi:ABC transporter ATP-binding protein [Pseudomonas putida]|uniref:ABC transporter ATP-binding protein n=1 Tax=Pseudomonas putida TaxID=303 RepID=A0AA37RH83_PSEPU|nr:MULTISPECIES: ABC transporter ATP-binding protein [Pseudomonas]MDR2318926.1 ABC transporter ATP-binding protein [Pseudomonas sp.]MDD2133196.1 ABC transporter ATP-binding protein [Pseudomonas kurunegalensis]GLO11919.1 ABC transporter ATP-binding protein [Pseudomonas putida]GLO34109.1 ABC transporter ATP-binding protein [Pseudomonas putida]HDS0965579.1 ABC transporter ATP-binding protein [Pseudomonas putida]